LRYAPHDPADDDAAPHRPLGGPDDPDAGGGLSGAGGAGGGRTDANAAPDVDERLARAQRGGSAGLWDWDIPTGRLTWTPELFALFGLDPAADTASFDTWGRVLHPDDQEIAARRIDAAIASRTQLDSEYRIVRADSGETRWIQALGIALYDDAGAPQSMAGLCVDITDRKRAEQLLAAADTFSRRVIESVREGIVVYGPDLRTRVWNPFMAELTGLPAEQVIGRLPSEVYPELVGLGLLERAGRALAGETPPPVELRFELHGRSGWVIDASVPLRDERGAVIGVIETVQDVTSRRAAEESSAEYARLVTDSQRAAAIGSYRADFVANRWWSSEVLDELFGIDATFDRTIPSWVSLIHPDDRDDMNRYVAEEVIANGRPFSREYRIVRRSDGAVRWVNGLGEVTLREDGTALSLVGTIQDVTERRDADEEREQLRAQLGQSQQMEAIGRLAGGIAHDFNNMLGAILGYAELALGRVDPGDELHADLLEIRKAASRSAELTRQLLAYARRETTAPRVIDLNLAVAGQLNLLGRMIGEDTTLEWHPAGGPCRVNIDPSQIDRILANLCVNARDAVGSDGRIVIRTGHATVDDREHARNPDRTAGLYVVLEVTDNGRGMDPETLASIFEPFFTTKSVGQGTGLGLAMVHGMVTGAGGFITVESAPGRGTSFRVHLPGFDGPAALDSDADERGPEAPSGATILVVEDEPALLRLTERILAHLGYRVLAAASPAEAIGMLDARPRHVDLLLTDVVMPGMTGPDLADRLRQGRPGLRCVFMSGYPADHMAHVDIRGGEAGIIEKPFSVQTLASGIRAALGDPTASASSVAATWRRSPGRPPSP
jgi:PAS domain S-box-containing protein